MSYILKEGKTYIHESGKVFDSAFASPDVEVFEKRKRSCVIVMKIYSSHQDADDGRVSLESIQIPISNWKEIVNNETIYHNDFDDYFMISGIDRILSMYNYINTKQISAGGFIWENWQKD